MNEYKNKRENFKNESLKHFEFLVMELGYEKPVISKKKTEYSDYILYQNTKLNKTIQIENHYHPNDYGFEFHLWNSITELNRSSSELLEYYLKENQDVEQSYIKKVAQFVKERHLKKLIQ